MVMMMMTMEMMMVMTMRMMMMTVGGDDGDGGDDGEDGDERRADVVEVRARRRRAGWPSAGRWRRRALSRAGEPRIRPARQSAHGGEKRRYEDKGKSNGKSSGGVTFYTARFPQLSLQVL